ncbi:MAG: AEC family transporter [Calditerrivibrio sp.]|nr:AEC family transporter [Calditerrivibrio sp.]
MDGNLNVIINQVFLFGILMFIGFLASKTKVITEDGLVHLARFIVKIVLPSLIFTVVAGSGLKIEDILLSWKFLLACLLLFSILPILGLLVGKVFKLSGSSLYLFIALSTFGNMGFIGIPLINEVYKDSLAGVSITIYTLVDMSLLWTFGVYLCSMHLSGNSIKSSIKNMINPTTIALFISIMVLLFNIRIPKVITDTIYGIGGTSKYLTMIYLGSALSFIEHRGILRKYHIYVLVISKMIIIPVVFFGIFKNYLPSTQVGILTIVSGLPTMTMVVMLAKTYRSDDKLATETIFITTIACLITIPIVSLLNSYIWR